MPASRRSAAWPMSRSPARAARCVILHAANRRIYGQWTSSIPSRFVAELPAAHIEEETTMTGGASLWRANWSERADPSPTSPAAPDPRPRLATRRRRPRLYQLRRPRRGKHRRLPRQTAPAQLERSRASDAVGGQGIPRQRRQPRQPRPHRHRGRPARLPQQIRLRHRGRDRRQQAGNRLRAFRAEAGAG